MKFTRWFYRILFGYDYFISYSRKDGTDYASKLANELIKEGYSCYIDQWGTEPGKALPNSLKRTIRNSSVFVLLASEVACVSKNIEEEIDIFLVTKKIFVPVNLSNINSAIWYGKIDGVALSNEKDNFQKNSVSNELLARILNSLKYTKQSKRIGNSIILACVLIISSIIAIASTMKKLNNSNIEITKNQKAIEHQKDSIKTTKLELDSISCEFTIKNDELEYTEQRLLSTNKYLIQAQGSLANSRKEISEFKRRIVKNYEFVNSINCNFQDKETFILFFDYDKTIPNKKSIDHLEGIIDCLQSNLDYSVAIDVFDFENYFDEFDRPRSKTHSIKVSEQRESKVTTYLIEKGINKRRITGNAKGQFDDGTKLLNLVELSRAEITLIKQ